MVDVDGIVSRPGGAIGAWGVDGSGEPTFAVVPSGTCGPGGSPDRMWHQLGNVHVLATAHVGGWLEVWATARGMVRLTGPGSGWGPVGAGRRSHQATWGMGWAEWRSEWTLAGGHTSCTARRRITVDRSRRMLHIEVDVDGPDLPAVWEERWIAEPEHLLVGALMSPSLPVPPGYPVKDRIGWRALYGTSAFVRRQTLLARRVVAPWLVRRARFDPGLRGIVVPPRRESGTEPVASPAFVDLSLPWMAVVSVDRERPCSTTDGALRAGISDGEHRLGHATLRFAIVLAPTEAALTAAVDELATHSATSAAVAAPVPSSPSSAGAGAVPSPPEPPEPPVPPVAPLRLTLEAAPWLERESRWHAGYLLGARQHDDYFGQAYVSQGSAYAFAHGLHGAPRDYAIFSVPLTVLDPSAARELLRVMLMLTRPSGAMHYAHLGRGQASSGGVHAAPTDLPIFLLWALTEHVWSSGDRAFLDEVVPFYPKGAGTASTVGDRVLLAWRYLRDRVGLGPHGLLRVGSGDWNDPISAMVSDRKAFHDHGESMFNTAFASYVLPRAAALVADRSPDDADGMRGFASALRVAAADHAWNGRWFVRGFDGRGAPVGQDHLFVDANAWALIAELGSDQDRATLVQEIGARCDDPSPIGATILDRPHPVRFGMLAPGWDCNGGVWAAVNGFLAWGLACHDPARAWRLLAKQSLAAHATAYPDLWLGVWSGPDAYNAHFGAAAGDTFVQPATPMAEFPIMNANAHAAPLLALLRVLGVEATADGLTVVDRGAAPGPWRLETPTVALAGGRPVISR